MPWRCPACQTQIRRSVLDGDTSPRSGEHYRCHVCRLELVLNERTNVLDVAPVDSMDVVEPPARSIPLPPTPPKRKR